MSNMTTTKTPPKEVRVPTGSLEKITPDKAKQLLATNVGYNRKVNQSNVDFIANEIRRGEYMINGEAIKIDWNGKMVDGQHTCLAVIATGITIEKFVMRNLDPESFRTMDTGRKRNAADVLSIEGILYPNQIASMVKFIKAFQDKRYGDASKSSNSKRKGYLNNSDISEFVSKHNEQLQDSLKYGMAKENKIVSPLLLASLHYICHNIDERQADDFFHKVINPANLDKESPIYQLHRKLVENLRNTRKLDRTAIVALICRAWNHYRKGKKIQKLQLWDSTKEPFPRPE